MTDYTKDTGSTGTMLIRVTSTTVEFWLKAGSATYNYDLPWHYYVNGVTSGTKYFSFQPSGSYQKLGSWTVSYDQTVTFYLGDSNTSGLGGPTTFSVYVDRTDAPPKPPPWTIEVIEDTSVRGDVDGAPSGGLAIDEYQVRYDESSTAASPAYYTPNSDGYGWIYGLVSGRLYYFWVRTHNAKGWSPWSDRTSARTHTVPPAPDTPVLTKITQSSLHSRFSGNGDGGSPVLESQTAWASGATTFPTPESFKTGFEVDLTNLPAGETTYVWGRTRNKYGWGPYSLRASTKLFAGAWVDVNGVKKRAVPYVRVAGVWKPAESWAKIAGLWKRTG